jgi:peptidoglycan hydrolase-like amidase
MAAAMTTMAMTENRSTMKVVKTKGSQLMTLTTVDVQQAYGLRSRTYTATTTIADYTATTIADCILFFLDP